MGVGPNIVVYIWLKQDKYGKIFLFTVEWSGYS